MADDLNKKIIIDIEVSTDGQEQVQQYKAAFDNFRTSINSIRDPLNTISNNIQSLNKNMIELNKTADSFNSVGTKTGSVVNSTITNFLGLKVIFDELKISFGAFEAQITAGLSL